MGERRRQRLPHRRRSRHGTRQSRAQRALRHSVSDSDARFATTPSWLLGRWIARPRRRRLVRVQPGPERARRRAADDNHDDGFQSWSVGPGGVGTGEVRDVVLRGNRIVNNLNPSHPLHATLQGIGCFDGLFEWLVENNVVVTDHWHGISLYGAIGGRIVNNTVLDLNGLSPGPPWIMLNSSNGTPSSGVLVRNNLATDYAISGTGIVQDHNVEITNPASLFVAPPFDLQLKACSPAIDAGSAAGLRRWTWTGWRVRREPRTTSEPTNAARPASSTTASSSATTAPGAPASSRRISPRSSAARRAGPGCRRGHHRRRKQRDRARWSHPR